MKGCIAAMAIDLDALKLQVNQTLATDDALLGRILTAATKHVERQLGFELTDTEQLPDGPPEDLEHAVLMVAAHWYENREATLVGVMAMPLPIGVPEILANYRSYSFG